MNTTMTIEARRFPVEVRDERTGCASLVCIVLTKEQLRACQLVGQSSTELIRRICNTQGYRVLEIGPPERRSITLRLEDLWNLYNGPSKLEAKP